MTTACRSTVASAFAAVAALAPTAQDPSERMGPGMMDGWGMTGGWGMILWTVLGLVLIVFLALGIAALLRHLRS